MQKTVPSPHAVDPALRARTLVLVGLMGAGKSSVGKRLAQALELPFKDADDEIERAAGLTIPDIFALRGEAEFREGERRVIARLLDDPPHVLATGGGAFVNPETRALVKQKGAVSIWLRADPEVLARRVGRKDNRPLLRGKDPRVALTELLAAREPAYSQADLIVDSNDGPHQHTVDAILGALKARLEHQPKEHEA
jgi:shikimate kinase